MEEMTLECTYNIQYLGSVCVRVNSQLLRLKEQVLDVFHPLSDRVLHPSKTILGLRGKSEDPLQEEVIILYLRFLLKLVP